MPDDESVNEMPLNWWEEGPIGATERDFWERTVLACIVSEGIIQPIPFADEVLKERRKRFGRV